MLGTTWRMRIAGNVISRGMTIPSDHLDLLPNQLSAHYGTCGAFQQWQLPVYCLTAGQNGNPGKIVRSTAPDRQRRPQHESSTGFLSESAPCAWDRGLGC